MRGKIILTDGSGRWFYKGTSKYYRGRTEIEEGKNKRQRGMYRTKKGMWVIVHEEQDSKWLLWTVISAHAVENERDVIDWMIKHGRKPQCLRDKMPKKFDSELEI